MCSCLRVMSSCCTFLKCVMPSCRSVRVFMSSCSMLSSCAHLSHVMLVHVLMCSCHAAFVLAISTFSFVCFAFGALIRVSLCACFVLSNAMCIQVILRVLEFLLVLTHSDFRGWACHGRGGCVLLFVVQVQSSQCGPAFARLFAIAQFVFGEVFAAAYLLLGLDQLRPQTWMFC